MKRLFVGAAFVLLCATAARADTLLHRQAPGRTWAWDADTLNHTESGLPSGQLVADKFILNTDLPVCRILWWGAYGSSLDQVPEPAPTTETMRIRFMEDAGGLPGQVLDNFVIVNPLRQATGFSIATGPGPPEYRYTAELSSCLAPQTGVAYWLEIAQFGDQTSRFRWEASNTGGEFAVRFPIDTPYRLVGGLGQLAYELRTPEPCSGALMALAAGYLLWRGRG